MLKKKIFALKLLCFLFHLLTILCLLLQNELNIPSSFTELNIFIALDFVENKKLSMDRGQEIGMTCFLFGNVDEHGELENDIFDAAESKHLASLGLFGLENLLLRDLMIDEDEDIMNYENSMKSDETNYLVKSASAEDFSKITELAEDPDFDGRQMSEGSKEITSSSNVSNSEVAQNSAMVRSAKPKIKTEEFDKPLGGVLPSKYANIDAEELFPDFKPNKVLRFSKLFAPSADEKSSKIWQKVKKRKKFKNKTANDSSAGVEVDTKSTKTATKKKWKMRYGETPSEDQTCSDDEAKLLKPAEIRKPGPGNQNIVELKPEIPPWRFGPAQYWYDMLDVPETGEGFDYGFKLTDRLESEEEPDFHNQFPDDAFLMVSQLRWEDNVIWDIDDKKHKNLKELYSSDSEPFRDQIKKLNGSISVKPKIAVPQPATKVSLIQQNVKGSKVDVEQQDSSKEPWYSIFPVENEDLIYSLWEEDVIWDAQNMKKIPTPRIFALDPNDENIIFKIPDDATPKRTSVPQPKIKIANPHGKKSKQLLGKVGVINVLEEETPVPKVDTCFKDPFNISNDEYYMPKANPTISKRKPGGSVVQHSIPAVELQPLFMPTYISPTRSRQFHRPPMKRFSRGLLAVTAYQPVQSLLYHIKQKERDREKERIASGGGEVFYMRTVEDLTGRDGELILVEFSEEHPPLMNQVGMCSKIKNYYKRMANDKGAPEYKYGETAYVHKSPFLGMLSTGQSIQALENNMYRAPIYNHNIPQTDFLVIRTRNQYYIREMDALFLAGQQCPLLEVPGPNSKRSVTFLRDFLKMHICRLFCESANTPRRVRMDDIKKLFPNFSETTIRKRLKIMADFKRAGIDNNLWMLKPDFRLPSEEELREMVTPEMYCAHVSMRAGEQRLKDAGYEKSGFAAEENENEDSKAEDEILAAPWSTTRAYIQATEGKCLLQLTGPADPTGCGEGFSYVRMSQKPSMHKDLQEGNQKKIVTGTDADLRKLPLKEAKGLLRKYGLPEEEIKKLSRWEVIAVVRTLSTEKAKSGEDTISKFSRGNKFSTAEISERYKEECQRLFDLQNQVLASSEVLSTDEGESSSDHGTDIEEMGKNIETFLTNKKIPKNLTMELEEQERKKLRKMVMEEDENSNQSHSGEQKMKSSKDKSRRVLKIYRTFFDAKENREYTRAELVRNPAVIDAYLRVKNSKENVEIERCAVGDEEQKEMYRKEKRRIQEQLRRIKRKEAKVQSENKDLQEKTLAANYENSAISPTNGSEETIKAEPSARTLKKLKPNSKVKCGACGNQGHMRTNKSCPAFDSFGSSDGKHEKPMKQEQNLINVEGTKLILSSKLIKQAEEMSRRSQSPLLKESKETANSRKRKRKVSEDKCDYLKIQQKSVKRRMTDPVMVFSSILEGTLNEMRDLPGVELFLLPVNPRRVPDYRKIVKSPMDLQSMREKLRHNKYQRREDFLEDVNQIVNNSILYNGSLHPLTKAAQNMLNLCVRRFEEKEAKLMKLEKAINPLLDDDDLVAFSYILSSIVEGKMKTYHDNFFLRPMNKKIVDYYAVVQCPMDVETIENKIKAHKYHTCEEFLNDVKMISINAALYKGPDSSLCKSAECLYDLCKESINEYYSYMSELEKNIALARRKIPSGTDYSEETRSSFTSAAGSNFLLNSATDLENSRSSTTLSLESHSTGEFMNRLQVGHSNSKSSSELNVVEKENVLEQDLQFSSEDESDIAPCKNNELQVPMDVDSGGTFHSIDNDSHEKMSDILMTDFSNAFSQFDDQIANQGQSSDITSHHQPLTFDMAKSLIPERNLNNNIEKEFSLFGSDRESISNSTGRVGTPHKDLEEEFGDLWF